MDRHRHSFVYRRNLKDLDEPARAEADEENDRLLNIDQVRGILNCSRSHVYNLIQAGELSAVTIGSVKGKRIRASDIDRYLSSKTEGGAEK